MRILTRVYGIRHADIIIVDTESDSRVRYGYYHTSRKRAYGRCTLHWAKIGGWADIQGISNPFRRERAPR